MKLIQFKSDETSTPAFKTAKTLLLTNGNGIQATIRELVRLGASELYAKSVVVYVMTKAYLR